MATTGLEGLHDFKQSCFDLVLLDWMMPEEELKARVSSQLRRWQRYNKIQQIAETDVYAHGLKINWAMNIAELNDIDLTLTQKEFALLKVLARNAEQIFTKEELYLHVWQQSSFLDTDAVTVHIKSLREKLQDSVKTPHFIQTVWGKGYRFIGEIL